MIGALILANPPRRHGARVRSRRGSKTAREGRKGVLMARTRRRRHGRRIVIRRRRRTNPVRIHRRRRRRIAAPVIHRRRRRRSRRNPLFLSRKGFSGRKHRHYRQLHMRRRAPRVWHNPRRRRRSRRNPMAVAARRTTRLLSDPIGSVTALLKEAFSMDSLVSMAQTGLGFGLTAGGSRLVYRQLFVQLDTPIGRVGTNLAGALVQTLVLGMIGGTKLATRALTGGLLAAGWQGLTEAVKDTQAAQWIPTLGEDADTASFRKALQREVLREISGGRRAGAEGMSIFLQPAGVSDTYLQPAGTSAYLTQAEAKRINGMGAYLTQNEAVNANMGDSESEFSAGSAPERF